MTFAELRSAFPEYSLAEIGRALNIPYRTLQNWQAKVNVAPSYVIELMAFKIEHIKKGIR